MVIRAISLGAGVQSSVMALMFASICLTKIARECAGFNSMKPASAREKGKRLGRVELSRVREWEAINE